MMHTKPWEVTLAKADAARSSPCRMSRQALRKGRPAPRECPADFDVIFVEIGRIDCETWYRASRITINRWLVERGKQRLIRLRADYVSYQRQQARPAPKQRILLKPNEDRQFIAVPLARMAADYLRVIRNGGWRISLTPEGDWRVGCVRRSSGQMLDMAVARGFDVEAAELAPCDRRGHLSQARRTYARWPATR
jgi:hypothetical protein